MASLSPSNDARELPARYSALADTAEMAFAFCERNGVSRQVGVRVRLIVEELFTNTIRHGYGGESDATIRIELAMIEGYVALSYEDSAPAYDLPSRLSALESSDVRTLGSPPTNLGTFLIRELAYGLHYAYENGRNRLWLVMRP